MTSFRQMERYFGGDVAYSVMTHGEATWLLKAGNDFFTDDKSTCHIHPSQNNVHPMGTLRSISCYETHVEPSRSSWLLSLPGSPWWLSPLLIQYLFVLILWYWALLILYCNGLELRWDLPPDYEFFHAEECAQFPFITLKLHRTCLKHNFGNAYCIFDLFRD